MINLNATSSVPIAITIAAAIRTGLGARYFLCSQSSFPSCMKNSSTAPPVSLLQSRASAQSCLPRR